MPIVNQPDRIITVEECDKNITLAVRNLKILRSMENSKDQVIEQKATITVWESVKHHIENGVVLTMDSQGVFHKQG